MDIAIAPLPVPRSSIRNTSLSPNPSPASGRGWPTAGRGYSPQRQLHQQLRLRTRNKRAGCDFKIQSEEFALAQDVSDRLSLQAPLQHGVIGCLLTCDQRLFGMRQQIGTRNFQDMLQQTLHFDARGRLPEYQRCIQPCCISLQNVLDTAQGINFRLPMPTIVRLDVRPSTRW